MPAPCSYSPRFSILRYNLTLTIKTHIFLVLTGNRNGVRYDPPSEHLGGVSAWLCHRLRTAGVGRDALEST